MSGTVEVRTAEPRELEQWDGLVAGLGGHRVTHTRAWIQALEASGYGTPLHLMFERDSDTVGCLPGLLTRAGPWQLFGSPRSGWQTVSMGPVFDAARLSTGEMMDALVPYLERRHRVAHIELMHLALDPVAMQGAGFRGEHVVTYTAPLFPGDPASALRRLKDSARRNIRRAERLGLVVRFEEDDRFIDEHYDQLREVYLHGGHQIPFSKRRLLECFRHLRDAGRLIAVSASLPGGRVPIATGTFFIENRELSLWMWAHRTHYRWYRPTELMTWTVMQRAMDAGCESFDLMGGGEFKAKLGAEADWTKMRWMRSRPRWLGTARSAARTGFRLQQVVRGQVTAVARKAVAPRHATGSARQPAACVLGDIDLVRALGLAGIRPTVMAPPGDAARFSRFTRGLVPWHDPALEPDALVEALVTYGWREPEPPVLFYEDDSSLLFLSRYRTRLAEAFRFVVPDAALVEDLVDKGRFQALAARLKLPVPPARILNPATEPMPDHLDTSFPLILKPVQRVPSSWRPIAGESKALVVESRTQLTALWPRLAEAGLSVLLQSVIPGPESRIESYHVYVDDAGRMAAEFTGRKIRTMPLSCGDSSALEITRQDDVSELGRGIVTRLKLRGVAKLDFKRDADGRLFLLEINPRFTLWHHLGARAGVNIPALVYSDLLGRARPRVPAARAGVRWCKVWTDVSAARDNGIPLSTWLPWALGCEAKRAVAWDDPLPLLAASLWRWIVRQKGSGTHRATPVLASEAPPCA
jgi:predicted ATP-grasp superfamily ATP-dependent carboligase